MSEAQLDIPGNRKPPVGRQPAMPGSKQTISGSEPVSHHGETVQQQPARFFGRGVLRHAHFRRFWFGAAVSNIGTFMESVGVRWLMTVICASTAWETSGNPSGTTMLNHLTTAQMAPMLLLGIPGGLVADRVNRRLMLLWTQVAMMVIAAVLAFGAAAGFVSPVMLLGLSVVQGVAMAFNYPAWQVVIPKLVPRKELGRAIALNSLAFNLARVVGPMAAGLLLALFSGSQTPGAAPDGVNLALVMRGAAALFIVNALSFLGVIFAVMKSPDTPLPERAETGDPWHITAWREARAATAFVFARRGPRALFIGVVLFSVLGGSVLPMLPQFAVEVYHQKEAAYATLLSLMGVGACIGAMTLGRVPAWYPRHHLIPLAMSAGAIGIILFCCTSQMWLGAALMPVIGVFWMWSFSSSIAAMQLLVDDAMRGRVMALSNTAIFGGAAIGAQITSAISAVIVHARGKGSEGLGVQLGVGIPAAVLFVSAMAMLIWRTPEIDGLTPGQPGHDRRPGLIRGVTGAAHRPAPRERSSLAPPEASAEDPLGMV